MIKLFASDLDGTLLARSHEFDELIKTAIEKIVSEGAYFTIATGRDCSMTELDGLEDKIYRICMNGSYIVGPGNKQLQLNLIDKDVLKELLETVTDVDLEYISPTKTYSKQSKEMFLENMKNMPRRPDDDSDDVEVAKMFMEHFASRIEFDQSDEDILSKDICKINSHLLPGKSYNRLYKFLEKHQDSLINAPCDKNLIEITKQGVNKGSAVHWLAQYLGVEDDEVAVYGDGGNDIHMLAHFDHSYAPKTANDEAKFAANNLIGSYTEYSVALHMLNTLKGQKKDS